MRHSDSVRKIGLARALSKLGYCSRSHAAELIRRGKVGLNGAIRRDPETSVIERRDQITIDGILIEAEPFVYLMMNKPRGVITSASDEKGRATVYNVLSHGGGEEKGVERWVAPVGRLDKASEGLLLLTNDSEWAARITDPESHLEKTYQAQINSVVSDEFLLALSTGVKSNGNGLFRAKRALRLRSGAKNCWIEIVLDEGKNRQIRRMMEAMGVDVLRLVRVAIGPLPLGTLAKGENRHLTAEEKRMLDTALGARR